jgi:hypothetical protein
VWTSFNQPNDSNKEGIFARIFTEKGVPLGAEFQVNSYVLDGQLFPRVASLANGGGFVISWFSNEQENNGREIYAQRFTESGIPLDKEYRVNA